MWNGRALRRKRAPPFCSAEKDNAFTHFFYFRKRNNKVSRRRYYYYFKIFLYKKSFLGVYFFRNVSFPGPCSSHGLRDSARTNFGRVSSSSLYFNFFRSPSNRGLSYREKNGLWCVVVKIFNKISVNG